MVDPLTRQLTLLMLSRMGAGDGGRETWLANFLDELVLQGRSLAIDVIHQQAEDATLLDIPSRRSVLGNVRQVARRWSWCPASIEFLLRLAFGRIDLPSKAPILAVGGLAEAIGAILLTPMHGPDGRIMWLRSIYSREKSAQLPGLAKSLVVMIEAWVLGRFGLVISNGADTAAFYRSLGIQSHVIPNAVSLERWSMAAPPLDGSLRVSFVGRLTEVKGLPHFLRAVEVCEQHHPGRCLFQVAGSGPEEAAVMESARRFSLRYHGQVDNDDVQEILRNSDVCVALTLSGADLGGGGVSNALVEQMAAGRIIVAWDNDIFRQVLGDDMAYLVPQEDVQALAEAFLCISEHRGEALARASRARLASAKYSIAQHVNAFFDLLEKRTQAEH